jgi:hypothetical protein
VLWPFLLLMSPVIEGAREPFSSAKLTARINPRRTGDLRLLVQRLRPTARGQVEESGNNRTILCQTLPRSKPRSLYGRERCRSR